MEEQQEVHYAEAKEPHRHNKAYQKGEEEKEEYGINQVETCCLILLLFPYTNRTKSVGEKSFPNDEFH